MNLLAAASYKKVRIYSNKRIFLSWIWVVLCSVAIFLTVPVARRIQRFVYNNWGREVFGYFVLAVLAAASVILLYYLIFKLKIRNASSYIWLPIIAGLYVYFTLKLWKIPEEAVHFLEYGLLGFFLFKALGHHISDKSIYITATLFALLVGTFDEILQWITPERFWDFRDAGLNGLSGGLFQLTIWKVVKPQYISGKMKPSSFRIFSSIFASCLILLGLCVSNTPNRVYSYTKKMPWLSFLQKEEPMSEFGYKYKDPIIGVFYSRLSPKRLQEIDTKKSEEYAQILNKSASIKYDKFLQEYNPLKNPFLHELRVHVYRRDEYFNKGSKTTNLDQKKEFCFIAYKENLILEKYFSQSIKKSVYSWKENKLQELEILIDKNKGYGSPVSANLFTSFSENDAWIAIFSSISILAIINLVLVFIKKERLSFNSPALIKWTSFLRKQ